MRRILTLILAASVAGCGKDSETTDQTDAGRQMSYVEAGVSLLFPGVGQVDALLPFLINPDSPGAEGIRFERDTTPGAPPFSYTFDIPVDGDGNGSKETTLTGSCRLSGDPSQAGPGFSGTVDLAVSSMGGLGDFNGSFAFEVVEGGSRISGAGSLDEKISGNTTSLNVDSGAPLLVQAATGEPGSVANACGYSLDGAIGLGVSGPLGTLSSIWNFSADQRSVEVTDGRHVDAGGNETVLSDMSVEIPCGGGNARDWQGVYLQDWSCIPPEHGQARLTITVTGSTLLIVDEDPPGSGDTNNYEATVLPESPHIARGFFTSGEPGSTYREDFTWTLAPNRNSFAQVSVYRFTEGPRIGFGGLCSAMARRQP